MHRDEDGADVHLDDALHLPLGEVGHGDVVAEQKGQALVVVLEIQAFAQAAGQLVDEAEHAVVVAAVLFVAQVGLEIAAQRLVLPFFHLDGALPAVLADRQGEAGRHRIILIVQHVGHLVAVGGKQRAAGQNAQPLGRGAGVHAYHAQRHGETSCLYLRQEYPPQAAETGGTWRGRRQRLNKWQRKREGLCPPLVRTLRPL